MDRYSVFGYIKVFNIICCFLKLLITMLFMVNTTINNYNNISKGTQIKGKW